MSFPASERRRCPQGLCQVALVLSLVLLWGCGESTPSTSLKGDYAGDQSFASLLGMGLDRNRGVFTGARCIDVPADGGERNLPSGMQNRIRLSKNVDFKGLLSSIFGSFDLMVPVFPGITAGGGIEFARDFQSSNHSENYLFESQFKGYSLAFRAGQTSLSPLAKHLLRSRHEEKLIRGATGSHPEDALLFDQYLENACGSEYISQIDFGATFGAVFHINYGSSARKSKLEGRFRIDVLAGTVKVEAAAAVEIEEWKDEFHVTVATYQQGGNAHELVRLIPDNILVCGLDVADAVESPDETEARIVRSLEPCLTYFKRVVEYGQIDFPKQLENSAARLRVLNYHTKPYDHVLDESDQGGGAIYEELYASQDASIFQLDQTKVELFAKILEVRGHLSRAAAFASFLSGTYSSGTLVKLHSLVHTLQVNGQNVLDATEDLLQYCWKMPQRCLEARRAYDQNLARSPRLFEYPSAFLDFDAHSLDFANFCRAAFAEYSPLNVSDRYSARQILARMGITDAGNCALEPRTIPSFDLSGAQLTSVDLLGAVSGIRNLNLSNNRLSRIASLSLSRHELEQLNLANNPLSIAELDIIKDLKDLTRLDLSGIGLRTIKGLSGVWSAEHLTLRNNVLSEFKLGCTARDSLAETCNGSPLQLPAVKTIDLRGNYLSLVELDPRVVGKDEEVVEIIVNKVTPSFKCPEGSKFICTFREDSDDIR